MCLETCRITTTAVTQEFRKGESEQVTTLASCHLTSDVSWMQGLAFVWIEATHLLQWVSRSYEIVVVKILPYALQK